MSDPMTNSEVEDVLSSIRRLVSDEKHAELGTPGQSGKTADKLVLTPSLRVSHVNDLPAPDHDDTRDAEVACSAPSDTDQNKGARAQPSGPLILQGALDPSGANDVTAGSETDAHPASADAGVKGWDHPELVDKTSVPTPGRSEFKSDASETLGAKIAALETLIADRAEDWEPDQAGAGANAGTAPRAMNWEHAEEILPKRPSTAPREDRSAASARPDTPDLSQVDGTMHEDALRALVGEIVRQELQGALGERITRNVRKLVRRELHRVLTSKDLE